MKIIFRMYAMDSVTQFVINEAKKYKFIEKIILFGSRARGDHSSKSDYDLAFILNTYELDLDWANFCLFLKENTPSLHTLDSMRFMDLPDNLKSKVLEEGQVIYERKAKK